jgi:hypothetical protein
MIDAFWEDFINAYGLDEYLAEDFKDPLLQYLSTSGFLDSK